MARQKYQMSSRENQKNRLEVYQRNKMAKKKKKKKKKYKERYRYRKGKWTPIEELTGF